jgi:His-Xaa-Ser system protein HxsD
MLKELGFSFIENGICFTVNTNIFPLDVIKATCYIFLDRIYIFIEGDLPKLTVYMKGKKSFKRKDLEKIVCKFNNELINNSYRKDIAKNNKKYREMLISQALFGANPDEVDNLIINMDQNDKQDDKQDYLDDPLQIAVPWEEKYGKSRTQNDADI